MSDDTFIIPYRKDSLHANLLWKENREDFLLNPSCETWRPGGDALPSS